MSALSLVLLTSCVKISDSTGSGNDVTNHTTNFAATDVDAISGTLTVTIGTEELGGSFAPRNVAAIWIEDSTGKFVRTLGVRAKARIKYLSTWKDSQGSSEIDGVSGATRSNHADPLIVTWDGKYVDTTKKMKKDIYVIRGELTDHNGKGETFSLDIDLSTTSLTTPTPFSSVPGFVSVVPAFAP